MEFTDWGDKKVITFDKSDTDAEKRIVEQGLAFIRNLLQRIKEVEGQQANK